MKVYRNHGESEENYNYRVKAYKLFRLKCEKESSMFKHKDMFMIEYNTDFSVFIEYNDKDDVYHGGDPTAIDGSIYIPEKVNGILSINLTNRAIQNQLKRLSYSYDNDKNRIFVFMVLHEIGHIYQERYWMNIPTERIKSNAKYEKLCRPMYKIISIIKNDKIAQRLYRYIPKEYIADKLAVKWMNVYKEEIYKIMGE